MAFSQKLFTSLQNYDNPDTRIGELNRIWYDSVTNEFRIQLDTSTPGGTIVGVDLLTKANNAANIKSVVANLWTNTTTFGASWGTGNATITPTSVVTDPLGGTTAYKLVANSGADPNSPSSQQLSCAGSLSNTLPINVTLTASIYVKAAEFNQLRLRNNASGEIYTFTLGVTPTATSGVLNPKSTLITNGWYRISWSYVTGGIGSASYSRGDNWSLRLASTGDGTSGIYLWGPQLEYGTVANSYTTNASSNSLFNSPKITFNNQSGIGYTINGGLYLTPAGNAGISAQAYDNAIAGGNKRGPYSIDFQMQRDNATKVASGDNAAILSGYANTASGSNSFVGGGAYNAAIGESAIIAGGSVNNAQGKSALILGGSNNNSNGLYNVIVGGQGNTGTANTAVTTQSATMNATATVTLSTTNASIKVGQSVMGTSIGYWDTFVAAISGTTLTLSKAATGSSTSTLSFYTPFGTVVGGGSNTASGPYSFVGGGGDAGTSANGNVASGDWSFVGGGAKNTASGIGAVIVGGGMTSYNIYAQSASGSGAFIGGGGGNNAAGVMATIPGGYGNVASGAYSVALVRQSTTRNIYGMVAIGCGTPNTGQAQAGILVLNIQTTDATSTILTSDTTASSSNNQIALPLNSAYYFKGSVIAGVTSGGNSKSWTFDGAIKKGAANSVAFIGTPTVTSSYADAGASAWTIALSANTTNDTLTVTVTGQAATTIRWVCKIETTEMTF